MGIACFMSRRHQTLASSIIIDAPDSLIALTFAIMADTADAARSSPIMLAGRVCVVAKPLGTAVLVVCLRQYTLAVTDDAIPIIALADAFFADTADAAVRTRIMLAICVRIIAKTACTAVFDARFRIDTFAVTQNIALATCASIGAIGILFTDALVFVFRAVIAPVILF